MDDALKQLRDLHLPEPPGLWPVAPGWWFLALIVAAVSVYFALRLYRSQRRKRPFRLALRSLDQLLAAATDRQLSPRDFADSVNDLLKRALIHGVRRVDAASLTGRAWLEYLDGIVARDVFTNGPGAALGPRRFAPDFDTDPQGLHAAARDVLRRLLGASHRGRASESGSTP
jgi:Domain of unknown function (DUF4381)